MNSRPLKTCLPVALCAALVVQLAASGARAATVQFVDPAVSLPDSQ